MWKGEKQMITKAFLEKHYKFHDKLVLYTSDGIKLTFAKESHYHMSGGHTSIDLMDLLSLVNLCRFLNLCLIVKVVQNLLLSEISATTGFLSVCL